MKKFPDVNAAAHLRNEKGQGAMVAVIIAAVALAAISLSFFAVTQQKQSGAVLTYSSANALMVAEAGLRYTEKCLIDNDASCLCNTSAPNDCTNFLALLAFPSTDFGDTRGSFSVAFTYIDADNVRATSTGKFAEAVRVISKVISKEVTCLLEENAATACTSISFVNNSSTNGTTATGECPTTPLVEALVFSPDPTGCPNVDYPDFSAASHLDGSNNLTRFSFCNMNITGTQTVKSSNGNTVWIAKDLTMENSSTWSSSGTVTINVKGNASFKNLTDVQVSGPLTLHVDGTLTLENSARINVTTGDAANMIGLVMGAVSFKNSSDFVGGLISNSSVTMSNNAELQGSIIANSVSLKNNSYINFQSTAGGSTEGYESCTTTVALPAAWKEGG